LWKLSRDAIRAPFFRKILQEKVWISRGFYSAQKHISVTLPAENGEDLPPAPDRLLSAVPIGNEILQCPTVFWNGGYSGIIANDWRSDPRNADKILDSRASAIISGCL
jgi:hypothetical protein